MTKLPEEGRFEYAETDKHTGAQWVYVTPLMARGHPQGRLNAALWGIVLVFTVTGIVTLQSFVAYGSLLALLIGLLNVLSALTLAMRAPVAVIIAGAQLLMSVIGIVTIGNPGAVTELALMIFSAGALFYLIEGDRPNLIYRHRFRSFKKSKSAENDL